MGVGRWNMVKAVIDLPVIARDISRGNEYHCIRPPLNSLTLRSIRKLDQQAPEMLFWDTPSSLWDRILPIAGVIGLYWILWIIYARTFHPYAKYPGPFLASISRSWIVMEIVRGQAHRTQAELHKKHGIPTSLFSNTDWTAMNTKIVIMRVKIISMLRLSKAQSYV